MVPHSSVSYSQCLALLSPAGSATFLFPVVGTGPLFLWQLGPLNFFFLAAAAAPIFFQWIVLLSLFFWRLEQPIFLTIAATNLSRGRDRSSLWQLFPLHFLGADSAPLCGNHSSGKVHTFYHRFSNSLFGGILVAAFYALRIGKLK